MNSLKTLAEFKRRIRQEELQAGQKNLHGRRFVNWLVQGGAKGIRKKRPSQKQRQRQQRQQQRRQRQTLRKRQRQLQQEKQQQEKEIDPKILFFKKKGQNVVTDSADSKVKIKPLSEYFENN